MKLQPLSLLAISSRQQRSFLNSHSPCRRLFHIQRPAVVAPPLYGRCPNRARNTSGSSPEFRQFQVRDSSSPAAAVKSSSSSVTHINPTQTKPHISASTTLTMTRAPFGASEGLNPPPEVYPPELDVPGQKPGQGKLKWLYHAGRAYIAFYKGGIANVRTTATLAKSIRAKITEGKKDEDVLTRAEWQITKRSKRDMLRLPMFGVLVLLLGEWLPLVVMYITPVVPEPCRIPSQTKRSLEKLEKSRRERERKLGMDAARLSARERKPGVKTSVNGVPKVNEVRLEDVDRLNLFSLLTLSTKVDAHSKVWDFLFLTPPKAILRWKLRSKLAYLRKDDGLIQRDGGWQGLGKIEAKRACVERGIYVLGRSDKDVRNDLAAWFAKRQR